MNLSELIASFVLVACRCAANDLYHEAIEKDLDYGDRNDRYFQIALGYASDVRAISEVLGDEKTQSILGGGGGGWYRGESFQYPVHQ